jgi:hypothetical protein
MEEDYTPTSEQIADEIPKEPMKEKKESKKIIWISSLLSFSYL